MIREIILFIIRLAGLVLACYFAYQSRLHAVNGFGRVIHEFDPYFNLRATEYLVDHGWKKFINWFDDRSWYPLGRPIGTTIYPGLQITAALIYEILNYLNIPMSVNDVCVFIPAWFSIITCVLVFGMAYETSGSANAGVVAAFIMAVIPAHIMRSVAGGYDNESIAMAAMCSTFYLWMISLRNDRAWPIGALTALSYVYMVAAWGGYVFVLNMIGLHAMYLVLIGGFTPKLHKSYSLFYVIGTLGAIQWPVVGLAPLKSLEQLGPMFVFIVLQLLWIMHWRKTSRPDESAVSYRTFQLTLLGGFGAAAAVTVAILAPMGYFGPVSSRVRGLFIRHTHTGNPLVDSVAEHQATQDGMYYQFFHSACYLAPLAVPSLLWKRSDAKHFILVYALVALYFSRKMNRLVLLLSPAASVLAGMAVAGLYEWSILQFWELSDMVTKMLTKKVKKEQKEESSAPSAATPSTVPSSVTDKTPSSVAPQKEKDGKKKDKKKGTAPSGTSIAGASTTSSSSVSDSSLLGSLKNIVNIVHEKIMQFYNKFTLLRAILAGGCIYLLTAQVRGFWAHSTRMAVMLSNPSIILQGQTQDGRTVMLDDFREAYWWIRDHTPEDSRVMSWWDYGYQISQIANRTTLADGNTWNHEHIALLGKALVSSVKDSHNIARHLADYVLVWSTRFVGNGGDDIAKSPHMARIGGSVFKDVKANEFYIDRQGRPSRMMRESLVYNLVLNRFDPSVPPISSDYYQEVYTSPNRMVRVYKVMRVSKDSKRYCAENRGYKAWLAGTPLLEAYPPGLKSVLSKREAFEQLEDFNARKSAPAGSTKTSSSGEGKMKSKSSKKQTQSTSSK